MATLLQLNSSLFSHQGQSSQLASQFVAQWQADHAQGKVIVRDLATDPIPHLDGTRFTAFISPAEGRTAAQQEVLAFSDALIAELKNADVIVLGLPMYNFGVPSVLKSYIDHVARAGQTFQYTATGPVGLLSGKKVIVFAARGGKYLGTPKDTQTGYVTDFFNFIGISDVQFVYAEGLAMGDEGKSASLAAAHEKIGQLNVTAAA
jgi:FMN-dependent NADH-azoreductase